MESLNTFGTGIRPMIKQIIQFFGLDESDSEGDAADNDEEKVEKRLRDLGYK